MPDIHKQKLLDFLKTSFEVVTNQADGSNDPFLAGNLRAITIITNQVESGQLDLPETRTPIDKISVPAQNRVRANGMGTSFDAAISLAPAKTQATYTAIYSLLRMLGPKTDDELATIFMQRRIPHSVSGLRARRSELRDKGWVRDSGVKRPSNAGHPSTVWEIVP